MRYVFGVIILMLVLFILTSPVVGVLPIWTVWIPVPIAVVVRLFVDTDKW